MKLQRNRTKRRKRNEENGRKKSESVNEEDEIIAIEREIVTGRGRERENEIGRVEVETAHPRETARDNVSATREENAKRRWRITDVSVRLPAGPALRQRPICPLHRHREGADLATESIQKRALLVELKRIICARKRRKKKHWKGRRPKKRLVRRKWLIRYIITNLSTSLLLLCPAQYRSNNCRDCNYCYRNSRELFVSSVVDVVDITGTTVR